MLIVLVGLPLLAMRGTDRPMSEVLGPIWEQIQQRIAEFRGSNKAPEGETPSQTALGAVAGESDDGISSDQVAVGPTSNASARGSTFAGGTVNGGPTARISAVRVLPGSQGIDSGGGAKMAGIGAETPPASPRSSLSSQSGRGQEPSGQGPSAQVPFATEPARNMIAGVESQLRDLGANHYLLEPWGQNGDLCRFSCEMSVGGYSGLNRHFEATGKNPLAAMSQVLAEVQRWRTATAGRMRSNESAPVFR